MMKSGLRYIPSRIWVGIGLMALLGWSWACEGSTQQKAPVKPAKVLDPGFKKEGTLVFYAANRVDTLKVIDLEFAETEQEITTGMMYRRKVSDDQGMLFVFEREEPRSFWMRNTYVSLDILYIDANQQIVTIRAKTLPLNDASIPSSKPAQYVLEVAGGFCERHGIEEGDFVNFEKNGTEG